MSRPGITYQEVVQAALQLQGQTKNPTVDNVRNILGTGSKSTIARHLKEWKNNNGIDTVSEGSVPTELFSLIKNLWQHIQDKANKKIIDNEKEIDSKINEILNQLDSLKQEKSELISYNHELEDTIKTKDKEIKSIQTDLNNSKIKYAQRNEKASILANNLVQQQADAKELRKLLSNTQTNFEHYQNSTQQLQQEQSLKEEKQRNKYEKTINSLQQQLTASNQLNASINAEAKQLNKELKASNNKNAKSEKTIKENKLKYQKLNNDYIGVQKECNLLTKTLAKNELFLEKTSSTLQETKTKLAIANYNVKGLEKSYSDFKKEIKRLKQKATVSKKKNVR